MGSYGYTGEEVKPAIGLMYSNYNQTFLIEGVDYKVEYSNNINPGVATAKVIGIGRYTGHEMSFTYTIKRLQRKCLQAFPRAVTGSQESSATNFTTISADINTRSCGLRI